MYLFWIPIGEVIHARLCCIYHDSLRSIHHRIWRRIRNHGLYE